MESKSYACYIIINKYTKYFISNETNFISDSLENTKNQIIKIIANEFKDIHIDYPIELDDFEYKWFGEQYINSSSFYYKIFDSNFNKWIEPWNKQEIYSDVIDFIINEDSQNPPDFNKIFGEPDPNDNTLDKFSMLDNENNIINKINTAYNTMINNKNQDPQQEEEEEDEEINI